jgi:hypothetical protein
MRRAAQAIQQSGAATPEEAEAVIERLASTPPDASPAAPASPEEDAQRLAYDALVARGRYQLQLARRALARWPDCADAWLVLGNRAKTPAEAIDRYQQAVAAGERAHRPEPFERDAGHLWSTVDARPYLRAKLALADAFDAADRADDAIGHYRDIVRLDRDDHLGARFPLLQILLRRSKDDEAQALIEQFAEDEGAEWLYGGALVAYRREAADAADRLRRALAANRHVPAFLTGEREIRDLPETYAPGSVDEAKLAADALLDAWNDTPGAILWLNTLRRQTGRAGATRRRRTR